MKEAGTAHWNSPNIGATNSSGFTGLPGGGRGTSGSFFDIGVYGYWWSSTEVSSDAWFRYLYFNSDNAFKLDFDKKYGFSVRCVKD